MATAGFDLPGESLGGESPLTHFDEALLDSERELAQVSGDKDQSVAVVPRAGFGTVLRRLTGVDEALLARVAPDRPRYTKLGVVILGTAAIATFSMWLALAQILDGVSVAGLLPAIAWGLFIANLDSWLVSSMHGTRWRNRIWMVLPRLALSVLFGIIIAEPLVLRIFDTAIVQYIDDNREAEILKFQTRLQECNPKTGADLPVRLIASNACAGARVEVKLATPAALSAQLEQAKGRRTVLAGQVNRLDREQRSRDEVARRECNGTDGTGLSGKVGVGPNCLRNRREADEFQRTSKLGQRNQTLDGLVAQIGRLEQRLKTRTQDYEDAVRAAIREKVGEKRSHQGDRGLLERLEALSVLSGRHWHIAAAALLLRLLFIAIDCLPMLVKIMGGTSSYDYVLDAYMSTREAVFREEQRTAELRQTGRLKLIQYRLEREAQAARESLDGELRLRHAEQDIALDDHIDRLTAKLMGEEPPGGGTRRGADEQGGLQG